MRILAALISLYLLSCNSTSNKKINQSTVKDSISQTNSTTASKINQNHSSYKKLLNKKEIIGIWASDNKEPLTIEINSDSIYYTEHFEFYKYYLKQDSIFIKYPDFLFSAKVYFLNDTLVFESENEQSKYYKFTD